jgi:3',5'-cyclic AMP phosphodiesterase CpdA
MHKKRFYETLIILALILFLNFAFAIEGAWNFTQLKKIDKTKKEFSFIVFSDSRDAPELVMKNLIAKVNREDAIFAICVGDLVTNGTEEEFTFFIKRIKRINMPLLTVLGNHDIGKNGKAVYYKLFGHLYYSFRIGNSYFIVLDNANEKNIDPRQMAWLKNELKKSQKYRYRFVFMHVPLYDPRVGNIVGHSLEDFNFAKKLNAIFDKYNVTMLFTSHIHAYLKGIWRKTPYIITGGGGAILHGVNPNRYFYHYIKVKVSDNGIQYEVEKLPGYNYKVRSFLERR